MDRTWMSKSRLSEEYNNGIDAFLRFAESNGNGNNDKYFCPCVHC